MGQPILAVRMGLRPTNRDESPVRGPRLFNELRWAFDRGARLSGGVWKSAVLRGFDKPRESGSIAMPRAIAYDGSLCRCAPFGLRIDLAASN